MNLFVIVVLFITSYRFAEAKLEDYCEFCTTAKGKIEWEDSKELTDAYFYIKDENLRGLKELISKHSCLPCFRSKDGRGILFWAYEFDHKGIIAYIESKYPGLENFKDKNDQKANEIRHYGEIVLFLEKLSSGIQNFEMTNVLKEFKIQTQDGVKAVVAQTFLKEMMEMRASTNAFLSNINLEARSDSEKMFGNLQSVLNMIEVESVHARYRQQLLSLVFKLESWIVMKKEELLTPSFAKKGNEVLLSSDKMLKEIHDQIFNGVQQSSIIAVDLEEKLILFKTNYELKVECEGYLWNGDWLCGLYSKWKIGQEVEWRNAETVEYINKGISSTKLLLKEINNAASDLKTSLQTIFNDITVHKTEIQQRVQVVANARDREEKKISENICSENENGIGGITSVCRTLDKFQVAMMNKLRNFYDILNIPINERFSEEDFERICWGKSCKK